MARGRSFFRLGVVVWLTACAESTGPPASQRPVTRPAGELRQLRWGRTAAPREFVALGNTVRRSDRSGAGAPSVLDTYQVSFWATFARDQEIQINYRAADDSWQPYVWFHVPTGGLSQWPDGRAFAEGDSVLITVTIDTTSLALRFEPTGLKFSSAAPAQLNVWYTGADPDFDASGAVDGADRYIEQQLLGVWVQEFASAPWTLVTAVQSLLNRSFSANLGHFSDYAVSW